MRIGEMWLLEDTRDGISLTLLDHKEVLTCSPPAMADSCLFVLFPKICSDWVRAFKFKCLSIYFGDIWYYKTPGSYTLVSWTLFEHKEVFLCLPNFSNLVIMGHSSHSSVVSKNKFGRKGGVPEWEMECPTRPSPKRPIIIKQCPKVKWSVLK